MKKELDYMAFDIYDDERRIHSDRDIFGQIDFNLIFTIIVCMCAVSFGMWNYIVVSEIDL